MKKITLIIMEGAQFDQSSWKGIIHASHVVTVVRYIYEDVIN